MMGVVRLTFSQATADELSQKLEVALTPPPATPEEIIAELADKVASLEAAVSLLQAQSRKIWFGETPTGAERTLNMVATGAPGDPQNYYVIYSLALPDIKAGDLIEAHSQWEATNDNTNEYMIGCMMILGDSVTDDVISTAKLLTRPRTENLTKVMHHMRLNEHGSRRATTDMTGKFVNVLGYCARSGGQGAIIRVEPNYGSVEVKVTPKEMLV